MDKSKINQTQLDFSSGLGLANLNLKTGRLLFECPGLTVGANSFQIATSLVYNSHIKDSDFWDLKIGLGNGWKLNIQQYVFPYDSAYNLADFEDGDYVYIDSNWNIHRFVKYKNNNTYGDTRSVYYDASGSGLRLLTGENRYSEIYDGNNSIIKFDLQGRISNIISSINADINKTITYSGDNLTSIYDSRKAGRKINFTYYSNGNLKQMSADTYNVSLQYSYNSSNQLDKIIKNNGTNSKDMMYFKYDSVGVLNYSIDAESLKALCFESNLVSSNPKIITIKEGAMKKQLITEELGAELFVGDNEYVGEGHYLVGTGKKVKGYEFKMTSEYVKNKTSFTYATNYTDVTNEKNIRTRYHFNVNGFTSSILEMDSVDSNNCKTLFKTGGWQLSSPGDSIFKINGQSANILSGSYKYEAVDLSSFLSIFGDYDNGKKRKNEYTENFVVSFWLRANKDINNDVYAKVYIKKDGVTCEYGKSTIDKTKSGSWQYITIPVFLGEKQDKITNIWVEFSGLQNSEILYLSDLRIAIGNNTTTKFIGDSTTIDLKDATHIIYKENGVENSVSISSEFFLTDSDLFATYKSLYYKQQKGQAVFDLVYCSGTKVKSVSSIKIVQNSNYVTLSIGSDGIPNYYTYSSNRTAKKQWSVTETQIRFHKESSNKYYYETKVAIQLMEEKDKRVEESKSTKTYEWQNANGTPRAKKDEYSVVTAYYYDGYGNLTSTSVYNDDVTNKEYLTTVYEYDSDDEKLREKPKCCIYNGVKKEFYYNEPDFLTKHTLEGDSQINYEYDMYNEKVSYITNKNTNDNSIEYKNTILYDEYGRIKYVSDLSNRTYGYIYNAFGEPLKYYENGRLVLEKNIQKGNSYDILVDKIYNNLQVVNDEIVNIAYENTTKIDGYGRILSQTNKKISTDTGTTITFDYQTVNESESVSKVNQIVDPYEQVTYNYIYDDENRPSGYRVVNNYTDKKEMQVRQVGNGDTQYYFKKEDEYIMSQIIKEDSEYDGEKPKFNDPRIRRTKYVKMDGENSNELEEIYKDFNFKYSYDELGRLEKKSNEEIEHKKFLQQANKINIDKKVSYETGKTTISKIEYTVNSKDNVENAPDHATLTFSNIYDSKNNITKVTSSGKRFIENPTYEKLCSTVNYISRINNYEYDAFDRLIKETRTDDGVETLNIEYDYYKNSGNLRKVLNNGSVYKKFTYENGRKTNVSLMGIDYPISYDNYGNIVKDTLGTIGYNSRNLLESYYIGTVSNNYYATTDYTKKCDYYYNYQGVRYRKRIKHSSTKTQYVKYYLDGSRILGEDWNYSDNSAEQSIRYFYDAEGITGLRYDGCNFTFIKDPLGNVSKIMYQGKTIGEYIYDAWGNCQVIELSIDGDATNGARDRFVLQNNPFRWKSHYLDLETGLYFVNGRYYSPVLMQYLNADNIENVSPSEVNALDRHAITLDNSITYEVNETTIFTDTELYPDPTYDPLKDKSWWSLNWKKAIQWIAFAVVFIVSIVLMCIPATSAFGVGMFMAGLKAAISGAIIGGIIGGIMNAINGNSFMEGLVNGAIEGFINGFTTGALMFCASQAISALSKAASSRCSTPGKCFIAGTLVLTSLGNKKIEDIKIGDEVWSFDEETGEKSLKKVVKLFKNKTKKLVHLLFEFEDGRTEKLVCTEGHPFYVKNHGWVKSNDLLENDLILMYNNDVANLVKKDIYEFEQEETTYNFEVEDYHTYYVGENSILVHNACSGPGSGSTPPNRENYSDEFLEWLNKGDKNNSVYRCLDDAGNDVYTGITKQKLTTRLAQHKRAGKTFNKIEELYSNLTRNQARSIETFLINSNKKTNLIRSVGENNKFYHEALKWAASFIGG